LHIVQVLLNVFSPHSLLLEDLHHLLLVGDTDVLPEGHQHWLEVIVYVVSLGDIVVGSELGGLSG